MILKYTKQVNPTQKVTVYLMGVLHTLFWVCLTYQQFVEFNLYSTNVGSYYRAATLLHYAVI